MNKITNVFKIKDKILLKLGTYSKSLTAAPVIKNVIINGIRKIKPNNLNFHSKLIKQ